MNEKELTMWLKGYFDGLGDYKGKNQIEYQNILNDIKEKVLQTFFIQKTSFNNNEKFLLKEEEKHNISYNLNDLSKNSNW